MFDGISNKYIRYALIAAAIAAVIFVTPYLLRLFLPFVIAFIIAVPSQRLVKFLERKCKINRSLGSAFIVLFIIFLIGGILLYLIYQFVLELRVMLANIPGTIESFREQINVISIRYEAFLNTLPPEIATFSDNLLNEIQQNITGLLMPAAEGAIPAVWGFAGNLTTGVFFILVVILSAFFLIKDYDNVMKFFREKLPASTVEKLRHIRKTVSSGFLNYIKAQLIIMFITFVVVSVTLLILRVNHALVAAFFIALVDFVPVFGTGAILVPWAIISLVFGDWHMVFGLLILQVVCFVGRNIIQPKILSTQIGIHPILTVMSLFIGFTLFGVVGFIFGPILALLGVSLYNAVRESKQL